MTCETCGGHGLVSRVAHDGSWDDSPCPDCTQHPLLMCYLIKTTRRLTFDIVWQDERTIYMGEDDGPYHTFTASNGYQVISRSRMDIQTERLWLLGAKHKDEPRSGTMVFSSNEKRDKAYDEFVLALQEWSDDWRKVLQS